MAAEADASGAAELRFESDAPEATEALAERVGRTLRAGDVVALRGEMGSGKTCFVRGLARGLGIEGEVTSPSFTLMQEYEGRVPLYHFDAWMTRRELGFLEGGGGDYLGGEGVAVVEWAERVEAWLPADHLEVLLEHRGPDRRGIRLRWRGEAGAGRSLGLAEQGELPGLRPEIPDPGEPPGAAGVGSRP